MNLTKQPEIPVEICINCASEEGVTSAVEAAFRGSASRVELCSAMDLDGLTPPRSHVRAARKVFRDRPGVMVMIRPHAGGFVYSDIDIERMVKRVQDSVLDKADGVVFGALNRDDSRVDAETTALLVQTAHASDLQVTFHRAFDATPDPIAAAETLIALGVDRILTSGIPWKHKGNVVDGAATLSRLIQHVDNRIEIIIGGGVTPNNARQIMEKIGKTDGRISFHAYSGVMQGSMTNADLVRELVEAVNPADQ